MSRSCSSRVFRVALGLALVFTSVMLVATPSEIPPGSYQISGTVVNRIGGHPLAGARVALQDTRNRESVKWMVTAEDGRFAFHVPAGKYGLGAEKRGFLPGSYKGHEQYSSAVVTGADFETGNLVLQLAPNPVLRGKVMDETGEPVRDATVMVLRESRQSGFSQIRPFTRAKTDDQGNYEVAPRDEGTYFVSVQASPWYAVHGMRTEGEKEAPAVDPSLDVAYPITYYGDTADPDAAMPIPIRGGAKVEADVHLSPVPSLRVIVRVPGNETTGYSGVVIQAQTLDGMQPVQPYRGENVLSPAVFEITGIPAGHYTISQLGGMNRPVNEPSEVELSPTSSEVDLTANNPASTVKAKITMEGDARFPVPLDLALRNSKGGIVSVRPVSPEGEVTFRNVSAGRYEFRALSENKPYAVNVIAADGGPAVHSLDVPSGAAMEVTLTLLGGYGSVEGRAEKSGKPFAGAMIVLVPQGSELKREFFRRDQSDMDGTFSLIDVFPGTYTVIAIEDGWDLDWGKPEVLARYTRHGQSVAIASSARSSSKLAQPVEVQPK